MKEKHELRARSIDIPLELFKDRRLSSGEKFLVVIIDMLDNEDHCFATNGYLADLLSLTEQSTANALVKLRKLGWVKPLDSIDGKRRLTTLLREGRDRLSAVTNLSKEPYSNEYESVTNLSTINNSEIELRREEEESATATSLEEPKEKKSFTGSARSLNTSWLEEPIEAALAIFKKYSPDHCPNPVAQNEIIETCRGTAASEWEECLKFWALKGWKFSNIQGLLECYRNKTYKARVSTEPHNGFEEYDARKTTRDYQNPTRILRKATSVKR